VADKNPDDQEGCGRLMWPIKKGYDQKAIIFVSLKTRTDKNILRITIKTSMPLAIFVVVPRNQACCTIKYCHTKNEKC